MSINPVPYNGITAGEDCTELKGAAEAILCGFDMAIDRHNQVWYNDRGRAAREECAGAARAILEAGCIAK